MVKGWTKYTTSDHPTIKYNSKIKELYVNEKSGEKVWLERVSGGSPTLWKVRTPDEFKIWDDLDEKTNAPGSFNLKKNARKFAKKYMRENKGGSKGEVFSLSSFEEGIDFI